MVWPWQRDRDGGARRRIERVTPDRSDRATATAPSQWPSAPPSPLADPAFTAGLRPIRDERPTVRPQAFDLRGVTPNGHPIEIRIDIDRSVRPPDGPLGGRPTRRLLLAFLTTDCLGCDEFWRDLREVPRLGIPPDVRPVVVTKGPGSVDADTVAELAAGLDAVPVVMSDTAWSEYRVLGYPLFVLVDVPSRTVVGETVGIGWDDVLSMVRSAN